MRVTSSLLGARAPLASFFAMGILWGAFAADLPDIKTMLGVGESRLGLLLLTTPVAAMLAMLTAPWLSQRLGRVVLPLMTLAMALAFALPGQVALWFLFPLAMLACGATTGAVDVLMNARTAALEEAGGRPLMNLAHAAYSFGYASGALGVAAMRAAGHGPGTVMLAASALAALVALLAFERDGRIDGLSHPEGASGPGLGLIPVIGGGIVLIAFMTENAAENWSALHIEQTLHGAPAQGSAAPAVLALTMGTARLLGHGLAGRVGAVRLLLGGAALSALGALTVAVAGSPGLAYAGFVVMGVGSSVISPTAFTLVGQTAAPEARARAVARATFLGYAGYFIGPPSLGILAGAFGLRAAFVFAAVILALVWVLAPLLARMAPARAD